MPSLGSTASSSQSETKLKCRFLPHQQALRWSFHPCFNFPAATVLSLPSLYPFWPRQLWYGSLTHTHSVPCASPSECSYLLNLDSWSIISITFSGGGTTAGLPSSAFCVYQPSGGQQLALSHNWESFPVSGIPLPSWEKKKIYLENTN